MSVETMVAGLLGLAAVVASLRHALRWRRLPALARPAASRMAAILLLQFACVAALHAVLFPPGRPLDGARLVVMTSDTDIEAARDAARDGGILVALPEAGADAATAAGAQAMPDLATARRMHPRSTRLQVLGAGLEARDLDAARGLPLGFDPPAPPHGLVELQAPARVATGGLLRVSGRMEDAGDTPVELLDPAGTVQDRAIPDAEGRFQLQAPVRASGPALFRLRLQDGPEAVVPVDARPGDGARLLLFAGAPNPELKYLRRWATDAGLRLHSRMALGGGIALGDGPLAFDAETLAEFDLAIVDERAWTGLGADARSALLAAVDEGLGLMLRITARPDAATREALRQLGFALGEAGPAGDAMVVLDGPRRPEAEDADARPGSAPDAAGTGNEAMPALARQPYPLHAAGSVSLLDDASGTSLARWRQAGRGRIAAWNLDHSFRLVLAGHGARHARLWSEATSVLARPRARPRPRFEGIARAGQRTLLCGFEPGTAVVAADGTRLHPLHDPRSAECSALWPERSGWHRAGEGETAPMLYVHPADALPGLAARERRDATLRLAAIDRHGAPGTADASMASQRATGNARSGSGRGFDGTLPGTGPRWPWFLAWLLAAGALWWLERAARRIEAVRTRHDAQG
ncbi:carboxypeptidase regulatory-like domain-containing protein [Luteimonas sp. Sa2BVA3]|uniref:Carboxypeptidase regulatory-like domain-containing protein n=1 Tax=Luteimonas colneyensis TaxID=2762230 RepID=A0ABR8UF34_9GAMM|nr:carboxypeptidase regulatory-like domain-containing protein [Luteimonas colneyensis]MBD7986641.1 carboxypeptidase regulatory-like domain-containing protein [Luteimonas colneyensis]